MPQYRLYLLSPRQTILARDDFLAIDDQTAIYIATEVCDACSDMCGGYMLWRGSERVLECRDHDSGPALSLRDKLEAQQTVLDLEDSLQTSTWRIASSRKLLTAVRQRHSDSPAERKAG